MAKRNVMALTPGGGPISNMAISSPVIRRYEGFKDHTVWLGLPERAEAFGRDKSVILRCLKHL
ncbi:hypothetical protein [Acidiferrobacter sp.]|uniref:hypothetical protein n=1 Tax=Acidiferrobacter sp. TaxID=1872107 RepID=UPI002624C8AF|nr:hypothetical protein [Acidiferrobacter sp.]